MVINYVFIIFFFLSSTAQSMNNEAIDTFQWREGFGLFTTNDPNDESYLYIDDLYWGSTTEESSEEETNQDTESPATGLKRKAFEEIERARKLCRRLANSVEYNEVLARIKLSGEKRELGIYDDLDFEAVANVLKDESNIKCITGAWTQTTDDIFQLVCARSGLKELQISFADCGRWEAWKFLAVDTLFANNNDCEILEIEDVDFTNFGIPFLHGLKLKTLGLNSCWLRLNGVDAIIDYLNSNKMLQVLTLSENLIAPMAAQKLSRALQSNMNIEQIFITLESDDDVDNCTNALLPFCQMLGANKKIRKFSFVTSNRCNRGVLSRAVLNMLNSAMTTNTTLLKWDGFETQNAEDEHLAKSFKDSLRRNKVFADKCIKVFLLREAAGAVDLWLPADLVCFVFSFVLDSEVPSLKALEQRKRARETMQQLYSTFGFREPRELASQF